MWFFKKIYHFIIPLLADIYYGFPGKKMIVIGVTGTKGKSTTCRFIASALMAGGYKVGVLSTVEFQIGDERVLNDKKMSMLGRGQIQKMMAKMVAAGCRYAVIETSSEGILQYRHLGIHYDIAVFTNLGTEHSERHGGFEKLKRDKAKLFAEISKCKKIIAGQSVAKVAIVNGDSEYADYFFSFSADKKYAFGLGMAEYFADKNYEVILGYDFGTRRLGKNSFKVGETEYILQIPGDFNIYNALAAIAVAKSQGITDDKIKQGIESVKLVEGRMEFVDEGQDFKVIVDYAHEPLSLTALFDEMRKMTLFFKSKSIALIGSDGGGRDVSKREKMGEIAGQYCDVVIVTDVNCFDEDPKSIAEMLAKGARALGKKDGIDLFIEVDRYKAIEMAINMAKTNDVIAITAKGTEPCICVAKGVKIPWDDRTVAREILKNYVLRKQN